MIDKHEENGLRNQLKKMVDVRVLFTALFLFLTFDIGAQKWTVNGPAAAPAWHEVVQKTHNSI